MDVTYTDVNKIEQGVLQNFEIDFDTTSMKDFQITTGINNNVLQGSAYWYIEGTEYGGKVDKTKILTETREIQYTGRNARGLLASKYVKPPSGKNYLILSGTMQEVVTQLIRSADYSDLFVMDKSDIKVTNYKFDRYIKLYDAIVKLFATYHKIPKFTFKCGKIHISTYEAVDYSDSNEYTQDDLRFTITKSFSDVNHLICLGKGELKERMVIHLYADKDGNVSTTQTIFGEDEVEEVYENTNAESYDELLKEGTDKLKELKNKDAFEVTVPNTELRIGDIIGGIETITGTYVAREIVNTIVKINDNRIEVEYKVGEDDTKANSTGSSGSSGESASGGVYNLTPADRENLGGVIIGDGLDVDESGRVSVVVDTTLSGTSDNPVQNKVVAQELNKVFQSVSNGKALIASAVTDKGVKTASDATFETMATNIGKISKGVSYAIVTSNGRIANYTLIEEER